MVTREDLVVQSVENFVRASLDAWGYFANDRVEITDAFTVSKYDDDFTLSKNIVAIGYGFDDGGVAAECGSDLTTKNYTVEFFILGINATWGQNLANAIKLALEQDWFVRLYDIRQDPPVQIDSLIVDAVTAERQIITDPRPWQEHLWSVHLRLEDTFSPRAMLELLA